MLLVPIDCSPPANAHKNTVISKLDNSPRAGGAKLDRLSHDIRVMTVLQGPVLYLHFPLTYKTELFSKKV